MRPVTVALLGDPGVGVQESECRRLLFFFLFILLAAIQPVSMAGRRAAGRSSQWNDFYWNATWKAEWNAAAEAEWNAAADADDDADAASATHRRGTDGRPSQWNDFHWTVKWNARWNAAPYSWANDNW